MSTGPTPREELTRSLHDAVLNCPSGRRHAFLKAFLSWGVTISPDYPYGRLAADDPARQAFNNGARQVLQQIGKLEDRKGPLTELLLGWLADNTKVAETIRKQVRVKRGRLF